MLKKYGAYPYILWSIVFITFPILLVIYYSFMQGTPDGMVFSVYGYRKFFDAIYLGIFAKSVIMAVFTTLICLVLGYPLAYFISLKELKVQRILALLIILPMWTNFLLRTYSWINILGQRGIVNRLLMLLGFEPVRFLFGNGAILIGMVYNFLPFMVLPIYTILSKMDKNVIEAARDLGANKTYTFFKVILPLSVPGIISGITMVFMPAVSNFVIPSLLGGGKNILIGNIVEQQFLVLGNWHFGSAISVVLMLFILLSVAVLRMNEREV